LKNIVIFASGSGSNAQNIANYFKSNPDVKVTALFTNNPKAGVIQKMEPFNVPCITFSKSTFQNQTEFLNILQSFKPDLIVLAGFLWLIPPYLVEHYPEKIINIHPALLPKYGGKGMYGMKVHEAVKEANEAETGITIHFVNQHYDEGKHIFQAKTKLENSDKEEDIARKIHSLEMEHFPKVIQQILSV
jgi:phosphoribosylglycinamide formyltransferase-1